MDLTLDYPEDDQYWLSIFQNKVMKPQSWVDVALTLVNSMKFLRAPAIAFFKSAMYTEVGSKLAVEQRVHGVYMMLAAYALENVLKAIIVGKNAADFGATVHAIPGAIKTHDLKALAKSADVKVTDAGTELLARLAHYAVWAARYPAPIGVAALKPQTIPGNATNTLSFLRGSDIRAIDEILVYCFNKLGAKHDFDIANSGYTQESEAWEGVVMHENITPWQ